MCPRRYPSDFTGSGWLDVVSYRVHYTGCNAYICLGVEFCDYYYSYTYLQNPQRQFHVDPQLFVSVLVPQLIGR